MTNPATGTASKLVSNEIAGADENTNSEIGSTPNCAPSVVASGSLIHRGARRCCFNNGVTKTNPHVASDDIHIPIDKMRSGSMTSRASTEYANACCAERSRPRANATADIDAIIAARRTEGSARVITTNHPSKNSVNASRHQVRARLMYAPNTANTNATF